MKSKDSTRITCPTCEGARIKNGKTCPQCKGYGYVRQQFTVREFPGQPFNLSGARVAKTVNTDTKANREAYNQQHQISLFP